MQKKGHLIVDTMSLIFEKEIRWPMITEIQIKFYKILRDLNNMKNNESYTIIGWIESHLFQHTGFVICISKPTNGIFKSADLPLKL